jgi:hypothetical protein
MRARWQRTRKPPLIAAALLIAAFIWAQTHPDGGRVATDYRPELHFGLPANKPLPPGEWEASGVVIRALGPGSNEPVGAVLKRPWTFKRTCAASCARVFFRQTLFGSSVTKLVPIGRAGYTATFPPVSVPCVYVPDYQGVRHASGQDHDSYTLWWSPNAREISAVEFQTETGCYPPNGNPPAKILWKAFRTRETPAPILSRS